MLYYIYYIIIKIWLSSEFIATLINKLKFINKTKISKTISYN